MGLSLWHLLLFLGIVFVLFGRGRLPALGRGIGEFSKNFKKGLHGKSDIDITESSKKIED